MQLEFVVLYNCFDRPKYCCLRVSCFVITSRMHIPSQVETGKVWFIIAFHLRISILFMKMNYRKAMTKMLYKIDVLYIIIFSQGFAIRLKVYVKCNHSFEGFCVKWDLLSQCYVPEYFTRCLQYSDFIYD